MPYTPTQWTTGDVITAQKLNKIEQGIAANEGAGGILVEYDSETGYINKNYNQLKDIYLAGGSAYIISNTLEDENSVVIRGVTRSSDDVVSENYIRYELNNVGVNVDSDTPSPKKSGDGETRDVDPEAEYYAIFIETVNWTTKGFTATSPTDEMFDDDFGNSGEVTT